MRCPVRSESVVVVSHLVLREGGKREEGLACVVRRYSPAGTLTPSASPPHVTYFSSQGLHQRGGPH